MACFVRFLLVDRFNTFDKMAAKPTFCQRCMKTNIKINITQGVWNNMFRFANYSVLKNSCLSTTKKFVSRQK